MDMELIERAKEVAKKHSPNMLTMRGVYGMMANVKAAFDELSPKQKEDIKEIIRKHEDESK